MRWLIPFVLGALALAGTATADAPTNALCRPIQGEWNGVSRGTDVQAMEREIAKIPPFCADLRAQAERRVTQVIDQQLRPPAARAAPQTNAQSDASRKALQQAAQSEAERKALADEVAQQKVALAEAARQAAERAAADEARSAAAAEAMRSNQNGGEQLSGAWRGTYGYSDGRSPVNFTLDATVAGDRLTGRITEPNTFGAAGVPFLYANVQGFISGDTVRFTKTYDGTGGQSHSVPYEGVLDAAHRQITGTWALSGTGGQFSLTLAR